MPHECNSNYISRKNDWPLYKTCSLVIDICVGQLERPNISVRDLNAQVNLRYLYTTHPVTRACSDNIQDRKEVLEILHKKLGSEEGEILTKALFSISLMLTICTPTERLNQIKLLVSECYLNSFYHMDKRKLHSCAVSIAYLYYNSEVCVCLSVCLCTFYLKTVNGNDLILFAS